MSTRVEVYCDFDGTVTRGDTIDTLLEALGDPQWRQIEERWVSGEIGSRECMALQVPLLRGGWAAIEKVLAKVKVDPTFSEFAQWCRQNGVPLRIVSDGIDRVIHYLLKREGVRVDYVWANHLMEASDGSLSLSFPFGPTTVGCSAGLCKCKVLDSGSRNTLKVVVGDGRSDFCWSADADLVFAKSKLLQHLRETNVSCLPFDSFKTVRLSLEKELGTLVHPVLPTVPTISATA